MVVWQLGWPDIESARLGAPPWLGRLHTQRYPGSVTRVTAREAAATVTAQAAEEGKPAG